MKKRHRDIFFVFGLAALALMVTQLDLAAVRAGLSRAGYWFVAVLLLWIPLYGINTLTWYIIIRSCERPATKVSWALLYRLTVSGFALNYATPGGLMGGEPYRIMALTPKVGAERASSSVILFVMTHIFSHFWFWLLAVVLYVLTRPLTPPMAVLLAVTTAFCLLGLWLFMAGYRRGVVRRLTGWLRHVPGIKRRAATFIESHGEQIATIDRQIAALHGGSRSTMVAAVALELLCRVLASAEVMFCLMVLMPTVSYTDCIIILAFTSLLANLLFFLPLQLGGREGGFMLSAAGMALPAGTGIFVALLVRLRELVWTAIGLLLIKVTT